MEKRNSPEDISKNILLTMIIMLSAVVICFFLSRIIDDNNPFATPVFILAVALTARCTNGYIYGIAASAIGVFCVNYMFTYPFFRYDMSIAGYPLNFAAMLFVSITISMLTTQIRKQEQLRSEIEREKLRADLLRSVSHDIRTPLTSILGASSALMENGKMPPEVRDDLVSEINKDAKWLVRITENILSVTRFSGDHVMLKKEDEAAEELASSAIKRYRKGGGKLPVTIKRPDDIVFVPVDATLIEQVLINLFENAEAHGGKTTAIRVTISQDAESVAFLVEDDGGGIPDDILPHAFDEGVTGGVSDRSDGHRSMGIGLSVCRAIVRAHGGSIEAYNKEDGGAAIRFSLPSGEAAK